MFEIYNYQKHIFHWVKRKGKCVFQKPVRVRFEDHIKYTMNMSCFERRSCLKTPFVTGWIADSRQDYQKLEYEYKVEYKHKVVVAPSKLLKAISTLWVQTDICIAYSRQ